MIHYHDKGGILYGLHRGDGVIRYVGITTQTPKRRMSSHRTASLKKKSHLYNWMRKHGRESIVMQVLAESDSFPELCILERAWIARLRKEGGVPLLNLADGGEGAIGRLGELSASSRLKEYEVKEIIQRRHSGERLADVAKDYGVNIMAISDIDSGKSWPHVPRPVNYAATKRNTLDERQVGEILEFLRAGASLGTLSARYGVSRATICDISNGKTWKSVARPEGLGEAKVARKLNLKQATEIKRLIKEEHMVATEVAKLFDISPSVARTIARGEIWKNA